MNLRKRTRLKLLVAAAAIPAATLTLASAAPGPNMVTNGTFDTDVSGWHYESGQYQWLNGVMEVINDTPAPGQSNYGPYQCITGVQGGETYDFGASLYINIEQTLNAYGRVVISWVDGPACSGGFFGNEMLIAGSVNEQRGAWIPLSTTVTAPANAQSAKMRLLATKEAAGGSLPEFRVRFDNVYFNLADDGQGSPDADPDPYPPLDDVNDEPPANEPAPEQPVDEPQAPPVPETPAEEGGQETDTPYIPEFPGLPEVVETPEVPAPPAPVQPVAEAPVPSPAPAPEVPQVEQQAPPAAGPASVPSVPVQPAPSASNPLPPATGESLGQKAASPLGALAMSFGLALASLGAAAMGAVRRK